ncbi:MAG: FHA domain-containing protein [Nannocystaceae bacterium]|nr:FHA domain-containing protein [Nannocystaceae bacterium]
MRASSNHAPSASPLHAVPDDPSREAQLVVVEGPCAGLRCALDGPELLIGRSQYANLRISESSLSQTHAKIVAEREGSRIVHKLVDLGSTNGTFVEGKRIRERRLSPGDRIAVGRVQLVYDCGLLVVPDNPQALQRIAPAAPGLRSPAVVEVGPRAMAPDDPWAMVIAALRFGRRYALLLGLGTVLGTGLGVGSYWVSQPNVTANFRLSLVGAPQDNPVETQRRNNLQFFRTPGENFTRPALIADALRELGDDDVSASEIRDVKGRLSLSKRGQYVWAGSFTAPNGVQALDYLDVHVRQFLEREIDAPLKGLVNEVETLTAEVDDAKQSMTALELSKAEWSREAKGVIPDQAAALQQLVFDLRVDLSKANAAVTVAIADRKLAKKLLSSEDPQRQTFHEQARPYAQRIAELKAEVAEAKAANKGPMHPDVLTRQAEIARLQGLYKNTRERGSTRITKSKNPAYAVLRSRYEVAKTDVANAQTERARLQRDLTQAELSVEQLPAREAEYAELMRDLEVMRERHNGAALKLQTSEVRLQLERSQADARYDMLAPPNVEPTSKARVLLLRGGLGAMVGIILMLCIAMLAEMRRAIAARVGPGGLWG